VLILAMANRLILNYCIERNKAIWAVKAWAYALGLKSLAEALPAKAVELKPPPQKSPVIATFSGCGTKNTQPFITTGPWVIHWLTEGCLSLYVFRANGDHTGMNANQKKPGRDSSFFPKPGKFYLKVISSSFWAIRIVPFEEKP
jgi:hypothetical protein